MASINGVRESQMACAMGALLKSCIALHIRSVAPTNAQLECVREELVYVGASEFAEDCP